MIFAHVVMGNSETTFGCEHAGIGWEASGRPRPEESWVLGCVLSFFFFFFFTREQYFLYSRGHCCVPSSLLQTEGCTDFRRVGVQTGVQIGNRLTVPHRDGERGLWACHWKHPNLQTAEGQQCSSPRHGCLKFPRPETQSPIFFFPLKSNLIEHR